MPISMLPIIETVKTFCHESPSTKIKYGIENLNSVIGSIEIISISIKSILIFSIESSNNMF